MKMESCSRIVAPSGNETTILAPLKEPGLKRTSFRLWEASVPESGGRKAAILVFCKCFGSDGNALPISLIIGIWFGLQKTTSRGVLPEGSAAAMGSGDGGVQAETVTIKDASTP
jgi:hypothetical protein